MSVQTFNSFLAKAGFKSSSKTLTVCIACDKRDAEWNYSDVPHLNVIHSRVKQANIHISKTSIANIFVQQVLGFNIILPIVILHSEPDSHFYYTTGYGFWITVETKYLQTDVHECRIDTTYTIWSRYYMKIFHASILNLISRNYAILNEEDKPMRVQRGILRKSNNIEFKKDTLQLIGFNDTINTNEKNICSKKKNISVSIPTDRLHNSTGTFLSDAQLVIVNLNGELQILPALCEHEGACLFAYKNDSHVNYQTDYSNWEDVIPITRCPWHDKKIKYLARMSLTKPSTCSFYYLGLKYIIYTANNMLSINTYAS